MELVPGHTLRDTIGKEAPMSPSRALALLEPVVSALAAAHRAGLVHRDVKPENVLIADDGRVKVADFGLAKAVSATTQHTATGVLIGTVSYIAPELVVEGRSDARADVYAVGVILYELLTGSKPHQGETPIQVAYKHVHEDVPAPSRVAPGVPDYVDALVARATARDREQRPADAGVLLQHLRRVTQALNAGVREDDDLVSDLMPRVLAGTYAGAEVANVPTDPHDTAEVLRRPQREATDGAGPRRRGPRRAGAGPARPDAEAGPRATAATRPARSHPPLAARTDPAGARPARRRRRRRGRLVVRLRPLHDDPWRHRADPGRRHRAAGGRRARGRGRRARVLLDGQAGPGHQRRPRRRRAGARRREGRDRRLARQGDLRAAQAPRPDRRPGPGQDPSTPRWRSARTIEEFSETVAEGIVINSDPKAGTTLRPGAIVDLIVSKGRRPIPVGDWVGKDADRAERVLTRRGLDVERTAEYNDDFSAGFVIAQDPGGGETLFKGDTVAIRVSLGPELVEVPNVVASGVDSATQTLTDLGFEVVTEEAPGYLGLGFVFSMDPDAGSEIPKGSTITLFLI